MNMEFIIEDSESKGVPEGAYQATFIGFEETDTKIGAGLLWRWEVIGGEHAGKIASAFTNAPSVTPATMVNALGRILAGLGGKELKVGKAFNPTTVIGKPYTVVVSKGPKNGGACVRTIAPPM